MLEIGTQVEYNGNLFIITNAREYRAGQYAYSLRASDGKVATAFESRLRVIKAPSASTQITPNTVHSVSTVPMANVPTIEKRGGYLYLNFFDNLTKGLGEKSWGKEDFYTLSLNEQYEILKRKLGRYAPDTLQEFITQCFPIVTATYCISMPAFEREIQTRTKKDGSAGPQFVSNVVLRPDLSDNSRRMMAKVPPQYDVILIGDITFGSVFSFSVKGIELIDSKVAKYGECKISCIAACAFAQKQLNNGASVPDYGGVGLKDPVLTRDFIDRLCTDVYPIPNPQDAYRIFGKWQEYIRFRKYYLGIQSEKCEEITDVFAVRGYVVTKASYKKNEDTWSHLLLGGHEEHSKGEQILLDREVAGADEFPFICVAIEKNRKAVLSETTGKNEKGKPKYEVHLRRYTKESMGLSPSKPEYDAEGNLPKGFRFHQYLLGERFSFTYSDIEPDYSGIENTFNRARTAAFSEIDSKYAGIIAGEVESFIKTEATRREGVYAQRLESYIRDLAATLAKDIEENKDKEVREEYAKAVTRPIEREYGEQIEALKKRRSKLKEKNHADEIAEIDAEIERLTAEMEEKLESAMATISIAVYYEARNARRVESQKKSFAIALQKDIEKARAEKKKQLEIQYKSAIESEKKETEQALRKKADAEIAETRENETIRRYEIYFRPENGNDSIKDVKKELESSEIRYLTYDNRAEKAKIERQEKALRSFLGGYVKNPYLASYLFAPSTLAGASRPVLEEPEWCLESLNDTQKLAVRRALASESIFLLQGPPGTGKTQVIAEITAQLAKQGKKILISSETHKAIDNVFERLPKIPEIRPLRLIPSQNGKETNYSPERLVDNFYLNIQESLRRQVDRFEHFHETKESFSEEMRSLRFDYDKILRLQAENAGIEAERKRLIEKINTYNSEIEDMREQLGAITEEIEAFTRTIKYIESYRFISEGAKSVFIERYRAEVQKLLSEFSCFADRTPEDVRAIVTADISIIQSEIASICGDDRLVSLEAKRKTLQAKLALLRDPDTDEAPEEGDENYAEYKETQQEFIALNKEIKELKNAGSVDISDGELIKVVSSVVIADKSLVVLLPDQIKNFKIKLTGIISDIRDAIDRERATYAETENTVKAKVTDKQRDINEAKTRYEELGENPGVAELGELSALLKQKIGRFFRNFGIVREYESIENALEIIREEWNTLESDYARTQTVNRQRIPMFKDICKYLDSPDILEEDRQSYTRMLYDNVNVCGITCTSRDRFTKTQLQELGKYGIDSVDIRTQGIDVVIIDEVSKSSFLDLLIPILYGKTVILVGDHRQLPPMYDLRHMREGDFEGLDEDIITKKINDGYTELYEECFFKTLYERVPDDFRVMLNKQYRCHSHIMQVFNHFYGGNERGLVVGKKQQDDEKQHNLLVRLNGNVVIDPDHHIYFVDCDEKESSDEGSTSKINKQEAEVVMALLEGLDTAALELQSRGRIVIDREHRVDERPSVGVICTYGDQAGLIKKRRKGKQYKGFSGKDDQKLVISTVDDFQGDERDIIIVSMVRNPKDHRFNAEFVKQYERINVAFSRARKLLIIVGAKKFLSEQTIELPDLSGNHALDKHNFPVYREIIDTINYRGRLLTANDIIGG